MARAGATLTASEVASRQGQRTHRAEPVVDRLQRQLRDFFWALPLVVTGLAALHQAWLYAVLRSLAPRWHPWAQLAIYGLTGVVVAWVGMRWLVDAVERRDRAEAELRRAYADLQVTHRQLLALHELGKRTASAVDVQEVLTLAARVPVETLDARGTAVVYFDPAQSRANLEVTWNLSDAASARLRRVVDAGLASEACRQCQALTANINDRCPLLDPLRPIAAEEDIGGVICLPLSVGQDRVGVLATYLRAGEAPDVDRVRMLNILATELAPALEGARLRSRLVASVNSARQTADTPQDLYGVLDRALSIMMEGWNADAGAILLSAGEPPTWDARTQRNFGELGGERFALALRLAGLARERRAPVVIPRMRAPHGLRSIAAIPLEAEGQVLGVAVMASDVDGQFALHQTDVLEALGANLALVIRNAQLYHRLREMAVLEERYRISREIHDGLAQTLGYLGLQVDRVRSLLQRGQYHDAAQEVGALHEVIREAYLDVRETIDHLRVSAEGEGGIVGALERLARDFTQRSGITVRTRLEAKDASLAPEVELHLLRIAQEALTNVRKHSGARHVEMGLTRDERFVELSIADAGRGFDPAALPASHHHGLASMRERAAICGGQLSIVTGPGKGTRVVVRMPTMGGHSDGSTRARRG